MLQMNKFLVGIRPSSKMFRVSSIDGLIIDAVLARRGQHPLDDEYFSEITTAREGVVFSLQNKDLGNILRVDRDNVVLIKDAYDIGSPIHPEKALDEFEAIWNTLNKVLEMGDVRRIGIAAEYQIEVEGKNPSTRAMESLCKLPQPAHTGKFNLRFEDRRSTREGIAPDIQKSDFVNVIYHYYDAELDVDHPAPGLLNANLDYQRYYSPLLSRNIWDEVKIHFRKFEGERKTFKDLLKEYKLAS
jgi:hypothetical protein